MKIGFTVWGFATGVREAVDLAVLAEESGFDSVFMVEGVCSNDALTTVAGMAGRTSRMALETCEAAGRHADGLMLYLCTAERYRRATARMLRGAETAKRDPAAVAVSLLIPIFVHRDLPTARQAAREFLVHYAGMSHYAKAFAARGFDAELE